MLHEVVSFKLRKDVPDNVKTLSREEMMSVMGDFIKGLRELEKEIKKNKEGNYRVGFF